MKITPSQYSHILESIRPLVPKLQAYRELIAENPRAATSPMRVRWDASYAASGLTAWLCATVYKSDFNDSHLDTALRRVMNELGFPEFSK